MDPVNSVLAHMLMQGYVVKRMGADGRYVFRLTDKGQKRADAVKAVADAK